MDYIGFDDARRVEKRVMKFGIHRIVRRNVLGAYEKLRIGEIELKPTCCAKAH